MLRIGKLTDYAMLILSQMAKHPGQILSAATLASNLHLPTPTVSKILKMLLEAQLVCSVRGAEGGYHLARPAHLITVAEVIAAMEGALSLTECCDKASCCTLASICTMKENWKRINKIIESVLAKLTLSDMLHPLSFQGLLHE